MNRYLAQAIAAIAAIQLAVGLCAADEPKLLLTGSDSGVWLVRVDDTKGVFDIALRKKNGDWKWLNQKLTGLPGAAVAGGEKLHVMFSSPLEQLVFNEAGDQTPALTPKHSLWPDDAAPLAMCQWQDANSGSNIGILAVVPRPAKPTPTTASAPTTEPASAPVGLILSELNARLTLTTAPGVRGLRIVDLGIFVRSGTEWEHLADLPGVAIGDSARVLVTTDAGRVYLMISDAGRVPNRLYELSGETWQDIPLQGPLTSGTPLAMVTIAKRVVAVLADSADKAGQQQIILAEFSQNNSRFSAHAMMRGDKPATWSVGAQPQVSRMGNQLALLWQDANGLAFGKCEPRMGQLIRDGQVDVFDHAPAGNDAQELMMDFLWVVIVSVFAAMLLLRPRNAPQELFALPPTVKTGHLGRRLLASFIDLGLCYFIVGLIYTLSPYAMSEQEMTDMLNRMLAGEQIELPIEFVVVFIATILSFAAYSTIMEIRTSTTLGKMLMKLRVVGAGAKPANVRQCIIRNLTKIVEIVSMTTLLLLPLAPMVVILTRYNQRIGDLLARTTVVDAASLAQLPTEGDGDNPDTTQPPMPPDQDQPGSRDEEN